MKERGWGEGRGVGGGSFHFKNIITGQLMAIGNMYPLGHTITMWITGEEGGGGVFCFLLMCGMKPLLPIQQTSNNNKVIEITSTCA